MTPTLSPTLTRYTCQVPFPKSQRLGRCSKCTAMEDRRLHVENREGYQDILAAMRHHYRYISMERGSLTQRHITACTFPEVYTSIIIDCCDKIPLPHRTPFDKAWIRKSNPFSVTTIGLLDQYAAKHLYYYLTCLGLRSKPDTIHSMAVLCKAIQ